MHGTDIAKIFFSRFRNDAAESVFLQKRASAVFHDEPAVSFCACHGGTDGFTRFTRHDEIFHCRHFVDVDVPVLHTARVDTPVRLAAEVFVKSRVNGNHGMTLLRIAAQPSLISR